MKKQRLAEYRKKYYKIWENKTASQMKTDNVFGLATIRKSFL